MVESFVSNKTLGEKGRWELHKKAVCCFKKILEAEPYETAFVCSFTCIVCEMGGKTRHIVDTPWWWLQPWNSATKIWTPYISVISSQHLKTVGVDYSCIEYMKNFILIYGSAGCMAIVIYFFYPGLYNKTHIQSIYSAIRRKLKPV